MREKEIWKPVSHISEKLLVSTHGNFLNLTNNRSIKPYTNSTGYQYIRFGKKVLRVHRLIALTFIDNPLNKPSVNHKDGIKTNNHISNLEWVTHSENVIHAYKIGLHRNHKIIYYFDDSTIKFIRKNYKHGCSKYGVLPLSRMFNTTENRIRRIVNNISYRHVS